MNELTITIRPYTLEDVHALALIFYNTIHNVNSKDYTPEQIKAWAPLNTLNLQHWQTKWNDLD